MDRPSISELEAMRAKMTPGEWWISDEDGAIYGDVMDVGDFNVTDDDRDGVLAIVNAFPALAALAKAALELEPARKAAAKAREQWVKSRGSASFDAAFEQVEKTDRELVRCRTAYATAPQAVRP